MSLVQCFSSTNPLWPLNFLALLDMHKVEMTLGALG